MLPLNDGWPLLDSLYEDAERHRLRLESWWTQNLTGGIRAPIIVAGPYRTGTTFLHRALAQAMSDCRALLGWEATIPTPPPLPNLYARLRDPRCAQQQLATDALYSLDPDLRDLHYEPADLPAECVQAMAQTGLTGLWPAICACPEYVEWMLSTSGAEQYAYYERCLATLDPDARWLIKSPMHSLYLDAILERWPDATLIYVDRDMDSAERSTVRLFSHLRKLSRPEQDHRRELRTWVRPYLVEHAVRIDRAQRLGYRVLKINAVKMRTCPQQVVSELVGKLELLTT